MPQYIKIKEAYSVPYNEFISGKTEQFLSIKEQDARNICTSLIGKSWDYFLNQKGLQVSETMRGGWWIPWGKTKKNKVNYTDYRNKKTFRFLYGKVKKNHWHLFISAKPLLIPFPAFLINPKVIITDNEKKIVGSIKRQLQVRKKVTSNWYNEKWREVVNAFVAWVSEGKEEICLPYEFSNCIKINTKPLIFKSPVTLVSLKDKVCKM